MVRSQHVLAAAFMASTLTVACAQQITDQRVDLGGFKLNVSQTGSGRPIVVFVSGLGEDLSTWHAVQPQVSQFAQTLSYDRAGLGKSDSSPAGKSVEHMTSELHALLAAAKLPPPYILVGHSLGGAIVQLFAFTYPDEIAGLVLVDPEDGRLLDRLQDRMPADEWSARQKMLDQMLAQANPAQKAEIAESRASGKALSKALPLPHVPTVLLTGTLKDPSFPGNPLEQDLKLELQNELLASMPQAKHVLVPNSRHYIQEDAPDLVIKAIHDVVTQARNPNPHDNKS
ncbi:MAG TPA: alpha/beta hydrolase [Terracidiphilus sp.]|jgi:pimeloyl-ACP methyl ester carboxylesterase